MNILTKQITGKKVEKTLGIIFIPLGIVALSYLMFAGAHTAPTPLKQYIPDQIDLHIQAQQFVLQGLKAPSTAKFPSLPDQTTTDGKGLYRIISHVDSQNSFGAMIREDWSVTMRLTPDEKWKLETMVIGDKLIYDAKSSN